MNSKTKTKRRIRGSASLLWIFQCFCLSILPGMFCSRVVGADLVPFVIPSRPNPDSPIAAPPGEPIGADSARLVARSGHFFRADKRVRLWGVNLSFGANFPTHEAAPHVAARLAAAGVNTVRCHHMDTSRWPRGIWNAKDGIGLSPEALDRLDFFIDQLARRGIYVNINLHVGREHSKYLGLPETGRNYDKVTNIFTPALIEAQKKYARDLLAHVNKYRKVRYADDPAIAIVEITNENSFFMWDGDQTLRRLPEYYAKILQARFNSWLKEELGSDYKLRIAWSDGVQPLGDNLLKNGDFESRQAGSSIPLHWNIEQHEGCKAWCSRQRLESRRALKIEIEKADDTEWHLQFNQRGLAVKKGQYYTIAFESAADRARTITCSVSQAGSPWGNLGFSQRIELTKKRTTFRFGFTAKADEDNARLSFSIGGSEIPIHLANIELRPGGRIGLKEGESLSKGNIALFAETESPQRTIDRMKFLAQTEKAYFDEMRSFIKKDLKCDALITGTIVFGPLGLYAQSDMDFIDAHAYWQHPRFPNRPWDQGDWLIDQKPMTDYPDQATLFRLAAQRLSGKPFTVSEYNHPAPLDSQAECVPMIASFAAAQDWDGIWLYTYSHSSDDWDRENMNSYFDIDTNPAKWGFMRAGTAIFRDGAVGRLVNRTDVASRNAATVLADLAADHLRHDRDMLALFTRLDGFTRDMVNRHQLYFHLGELRRPPEPEPTPAVVSWYIAPPPNPDALRPSLLKPTKSREGVYFVAGRRAHIFAGSPYGLNRISSFNRIVAPKFAVVTVVTLDGEALDRSAKILITACGRAENAGMKFSDDRRTVGRNWGTAPAMIEPVQGTLPIRGVGWTCRPIGPDGMPTAQIQTGELSAIGLTLITLHPKYKTMWYLLTRSEKANE